MGDVYSYSSGEAMNAELLRYSPDAIADWPTPEALGLVRGDVSVMAESAARQLDYKPGDSLEPVVDQLGGQIVYSDETDELANSGSIRIAPGSFLISLPLDSGPLRDRFTIAHELGHYFLHYLYPNQVHDAGITHLRAMRYGSDQAEWEANWFAAAFLMPSDAFKAEYEHLSGDLLAVADHFRVSQQAAYVRAKSLRLL